MKIKTNTKELEIYERGMGLIPKQIPRIVSAVLNDQAQSMRNIFIPESLDNAFVIRDKRFMKRQLWTNFAKANKSVSNNSSEVGSVGISEKGKGEFTGWEEQQTGTAPKKQRTATTDIARGGSFSKKHRPSTRMKKGSFRRQSEYQGRSKKHRIFQMIREAQKQKLNFILRDGEGNQLNIPDGLYGWRGRKLRMLQSFKKQKAKRVDWMGKALDMMIKKRGRFDRLFERKLNRAIEKTFKLKG